MLPQVSTSGTRREDVPDLRDLGHKGEPFKLTKDLVLAYFNAVGAGDLETKVDL